MVAGADPARRRDRLMAPPRHTARGIEREADDRLYSMVQSQLEIARHQAEGWRNFLATATGLLAAVLVLKGRENVAELPGAYRLGVVVSVSLGLLALLVSAFLAASAAHGRPRDRLEYADGAELLRWEAEQTEIVGKLVNRARWLAVTGVALTAAGVMTTWMAPAAEKGGAASVTVHTRDGKVCGELVELDAQGVTVRMKAAAGSKADTASKAETLRRMRWGAEAISATPTEACQGP
ncbi:hypothetical protein [Streptomyces sp. WG-D5]